MESLKKKIFLIDSSINLDDFQKNQLDNSSLLITFDYSSHKYFLEKNISHLISEDFISDETLDAIQHKSYVLSKWYEIPSISKELEYSGINLGKLLHEQIVVFLVNFIKKLFEINSISKKFPNSNFFSYGLMFDILKLFEINSSKLELPTNNITFAHDKVRYNIKIGNKYFLFLIPRKYYLKIKKLSEILIHKFFNPETRNMTKKNCLYVELPTIRFKELFLQSAENQNSLFFCRRRPAIWNFESFSILRKSHTKIITQYSIIDKKFEKIIRDNFDIYLEKFSNFWLRNQMILNDFFSLNDKSFWFILYPIFSKLISSRLNEFIFEIELVKKMFNTYNFNSILVLSEIGVTEQIVVRFAKNLKIPVVLLQLGYHHDTKEAQETNHSQAVYPINADKFVVWGNISKQDAMENGHVNDKDVVMIGSPRYDNISNQVKNCDYILLAASGPVQMQLRSSTIKSYEKYESEIIEICKIVKKMDKKLIIKIHPSPTEYDLTHLIKTKFPDIDVITTGDILPLIKSCELMIVTGLSTSILEAHLLKKPVISVPILNFNLGVPKIFSSDSCIVSPINFLEKNLYELINNKKFKEELLKRSDIFIKNYFENFNDASYRLNQFLSKF